jgi:hypothetical protein
MSLLSDSNQIITKDQWMGTGGITTQYENNKSAFNQTHYVNGAKIGGSRSRRFLRRSKRRFFSRRVGLSRKYKKAIRKIKSLRRKLSRRR